MFTVKNHKLYKEKIPVNYVASKNKGGIIQPLYIVLHDTASPLSVQGDINWLSGVNNNSSSAHFVVARNGGVTQLVPTNIKAWHAGVSKWNGRTNCNDFTIGIEIDNPGKVEKIDNNTYKSYFGKIFGNENVDFTFAQTPQHGKGYWAFYTQEQIESIVGICQALIKAYSCTEIITHWMISPGRKIDTNPLFPLEQVRERAFGGKDFSTIPPDLSFVPDAIVTVDNLNLRSQPMVGDNIIEAIGKGSRVDVQAVDGNWYKVNLSNGKGGYLHKSFVKLD